MDKEFLKTFRKTAGLTQKEFAEKLGVSRQLITAIERGKRIIQPYIVTRIYIEFGEEYVEQIRKINDNYVK